MGVADAPARALVLFGDGLMEAISPTHNHLHALAASGACGFLALNYDHPPVDDSSKSFLHMQQLLGVHEFMMINQTEVPTMESISSKQSSIPSIANRFMEMKAALITNSEPMARLGEICGLKVTNGKVRLDFTEDSTFGTVPELPCSADVAAELLDLLGLGTSYSEHSDTFELVLVHMSGRSCTKRDSFSREYLKWMDGIISNVATLMQPGTKANDHLYLALILSYAANNALQAKLEEKELQSVHLRTLPPNIRSLRPRQTYEMKDGRPIHDVRDHCPMLVVHKMDGVTRRDLATSIGFDEFWKNGCNCTILADRFLHEVAFKLWKAPKYGA